MSLDTPVSDLQSVPSSQLSLPPTEPASPTTLTPPPSTQKTLCATAPSQPSKPMFSPASITGGSSSYTAPSDAAIDGADKEDLRRWLRECIAEQNRAKMELAHQKFQLNLASLQAADDAERAVVEHEMALREVETLRNDSVMRRARREGEAGEGGRVREMRVAYEEAVEMVKEGEAKLRTARKVIRQSQDEIVGLRECRAQLLNRIRENREHFNLLRNPGGLLHSPGASGTKTAGTPRQTTKGRVGRPRADTTPVQEPFAALLRALEKTAGPTGPPGGAATGSPAVTRTGRVGRPKHTRNSQSLSALPVVGRDGIFAGDMAGTGSRESTISATEGDEARWERAGKRRGDDAGGPAKRVKTETARGR